jgi:integrase
MSIEKRSENTYRLTVSMGYTKEGKKLRKQKTIDLSDIPVKKQMREAEKQYALFENEVKKGQYIDNEKITFEDFTELWLKDYAIPNLQPKTLHEYKRLLQRIIVAIGHIKLCHLQPIHLTAFYNNLREDGIRKDKNAGGLSPKTITHYHRLISTILETGVQWNLLANNPASRVKPPKLEKHEARHFNIEQTQYILELLESEPLKYRTMIVLSIFGGMRQGELTALTWGDVDLENFTIKIDKSLQHLPGMATFTKSTKTETTRIISVPASVIDLLKKYKLWQSEEKLNLGNLWHNEVSFIFTAFDGKAIFPSTISKWFLKFLRKHNEIIMNDDTISDKEKYLLPEVNFHGIRHTHATILINQNTDIATISKRLGHAKISTTTDIYTHSLQKADRSASDNLDHLFNKINIEDQKRGY